jgi:hypothetical protein
MALAIDKQDRETAKREKLHLFQISVDSKYAEKYTGKSDSSGGCSEEYANELRYWIRNDTVNISKLDMFLQTLRTRLSKFTDKDLQDLDRIISGYECLVEEKVPLKTRKDYDLYHESEIDGG